MPRPEPAQIAALTRRVEALEKQAKKKAPAKKAPAKKKS